MMGGRVPRNPTDFPQWVRRQTGDLAVPLSKAMMDMSVRIIGDIFPEKNAPKTLLGYKRGTRGTGFVVSVPSETLVGVRYQYVLTAHHVIDCQSKPEMQAPNPFASGELYPAMTLTDWCQPLDGVDLAMHYLEEGSDERGHQIIRGVFMEDGAMPPDHVPSLGSDVYYIGHLDPLNRMMVRSGTIGALEQKAVKHEQPEYDYECHLVDCRSYGGFSGSPCFFPQVHPGLREFPKSQIMGDVPPHVPPLGSMVYLSVLCGMFTEHLDDREPNVDGTVSRYGVGVLLPSRDIWRALMTKKDERLKWDKERKAISDESGPQLRQASTGRNDEYARFERLAKQVVNTPKPDKEEGGRGA